MSCCGTGLSHGSGYSKGRVSGLCQCAHACRRLKGIIQTEFTVAVPAKVTMTMTMTGMTGVAGLSLACD